MAHDIKLGSKYHEVIGQQSFLGASVINYNLSLGFGNQPSRLQMNLIEDSEHDQTPEGNTRFYNAVHEGYHPWKETVLPFDLDTLKHDDNLGQMPPPPALAAGGDKYPPYTGGRSGLPVLTKIDHPTEGTCSDDTAKTELECAALATPGEWTPAKKFAYTHGDKFFFVGNAEDSEGKPIKKTILGSPVWFNWYRYDKVDAEDPECTGVNCGKEGDIVRKDFNATHPWYFNGILTNVERDYGTGSGKIISATVEDPRAILAGTHVILGKFQGRTMTADGSLETITSPYPKRLYKHGFMGYYNVLNVYGFLEEVYGFGSVPKNESGIIWWDKDGENSASRKTPYDERDIPQKHAQLHDPIGKLEDYAQPPGTNVLDVLQWMLMGSADAEHGKLKHGPKGDGDNIGWPKTREPGSGFFKGYRYHGPSTDDESNPDNQRPTDSTGERVGQERYGGLLYYVQNPLVKDVSNINKDKDGNDAPGQDYLYGPANYLTGTGYGTLPVNVNRFKVDLSELKKLYADTGEGADGLLDSNFRIQADDMTLLDLIQNLCDYASADFYVELLPDMAPWPRGQKEMVCRDAAGTIKETSQDGNNPITTLQECHDAGGQTFEAEVRIPQTGEGVTGVIKVRVIHRNKVPSHGILEEMIKDSEFDPNHIDIDDDPDPAVAALTSKHFKKWRGRVASSKIGYEFADLPVGKMLMGAPRTRMVGVDSLGTDILRTEFGDCIDQKDTINVDLSDVPIAERKQACEKLGNCYDKGGGAPYVDGGTCADQEDEDVPPATYPSRPGYEHLEGTVIRNKDDCEDVAVLPDHGQWCPHQFNPGRQRSDFDGVEFPTSRTDLPEGFFGKGPGEEELTDTNQMIEDSFGRDILGNQTLYEKRDYRNDFWVNAINNQPHLMRISGPRGVNDNRDATPDAEGWGDNENALYQTIPGDVILGGDDYSSDTDEELADQPLFGDGKRGSVSFPNDSAGGDGYADLYPAWGLHDRPDYCAMIVPEASDLDEGSSICDGIMGCSWRWEDEANHQLGGLCKQTIGVKKLKVPKKGFFWDDEPNKDFNPPNPDFGYFRQDRADRDDSWTRFNPVAGLMSMYEWVIPNCNEDIYAFPDCRAINTFRGEGYRIEDQFGLTPEHFRMAEHSRPRIKRNAECQTCNKENFVCHDTVNDAEATSLGGGNCPAAGEVLAKKEDCETLSCHASPLIANGAVWVGGGCAEWIPLPPSNKTIKDVDDCFCNNDAEFERGTVDGDTVSPSTCSGTGNEDFTNLEEYDSLGNPVLSESRRTTGGKSAAMLPDSAIIEIDMKEVYKLPKKSLDGSVSLTDRLEDPLYTFGEDNPLVDRKYIYKATATELRAAASSKTAWEDYLAQWGIKLQEDMKWTNNIVAGFFKTAYVGSKRGGKQKAGEGGDKVAPVEPAVAAAGPETGPGETASSAIGNREALSNPASTKSNTSELSINTAGGSQRRGIEIDSDARPSNLVDEEIDIIFRKLADIGQNWYGKAYLMPLPYDPEDIKEHVRSINSDDELESPKLELDWDIASEAFVEMEFDRIKKSFMLKYPLSANFSSDEGKMGGFFVFPQEYKGIRSTDGEKPPSNMQINVNPIATEDRFITVVDPEASPGDNNRGKVFVKADVDGETYWLWDDDADVIEYVRKNAENQAGFNLIDAFNPKKNGSCEDEAAVTGGNDPLSILPSSNQEDCENTEVNSTCSLSQYTTYDECVNATPTAGEWTDGDGVWTPAIMPKLKPYALLKMSNAVEYDAGETDKEQALSGRTAVSMVFNVLFNWKLKMETKAELATLGLDILKGDLIPARFKPFGAAVPQVSNRHVWGPWSLGIDFGKVEVQKDNTFQPSNFGTIDKMNRAALSKIKADLVSHQITESGFVELTGGPEYFAGRPIGKDEDFITYLVNNGIDPHQGLSPYITDIGVDTNPSAGITTKYTMRTWAPRLGKLEEWKLRQGISQTRDKYRSDMEKNTEEHKRLTRPASLRGSDTSPPAVPLPRNIQSN